MGTMCLGRATGVTTDQTETASWPLCGCGLYATRIDESDERVYGSEFESDMEGAVRRLDQVWEVGSDVVEWPLRSLKSLSVAAIGDR